uniref:Uncharacterized protein n=1 Tax=Timema tahoe TaxID=61484 RepID=A0A7R9FIR8_9NEOP|nr:unnamed protein product [Timema tahoe]
MFSLIRVSDLAIGMLKVSNRAHRLLNEGRWTERKKEGLFSESMGMAPLQPVLPTLQQHSSLVTTSSSTIQVGSTWTNSGSLNIDIDNLSISGVRGGSKAVGSGLPMNQLPGNIPTSPLHSQPTGVPPLRPQTTPTPITHAAFFPAFN